MVTKKCLNNPSHGGHPSLTSSALAWSLTSASFWIIHTKSTRIKPCPTPTCLPLHKRKWAEWSHLLTSCPAPESSPTLSILPRSTPSMRVQRTALVASALRRSSCCLPNYAWLGEEEPNSIFSLQPRATGLPDQAKGCRSGWRDSTLCSTPTEAQQSPCVTFPPPRNPCILSSSHICTDSDWSWGCSIALGEMDGDPTPSPFSGWKMDSWQWGCTGKASVLRETQIYREKIDSMQKRCAALNETRSQLNLCSSRFDVNHLSFRLLRKLSAIHHVFSSHPGTCCLPVVFFSPYQRLLSEKASPICPFQQSEDISQCIFSAINIFMSSFISWWGMEGVHSLGP